MAGGIDELIDVLYGMVEDATALPLGRDRCIIEREKALDLLDELRGNLPGEIKAAREIVEKRNDLIASGKKDAELLMHEAEVKVRELIDTNEITLQAKVRAKDTLAQADAQSAEIKRAANAYCDELMTRTEEAITASLTELRRLHSQFQSSTGIKSIEVK